MIYLDYLLRTQRSSGAKWWCNSTNTVSLKSGVHVALVLHGNVAFACMMSRVSRGIFSLLTRLLGGQGERLHWSKDKAMPPFRWSVFPPCNRFVHPFLFPPFLNSLLPSCLFSSMQLTTAITYQNQLFLSYILYLPRIEQTWSVMWNKQIFHILNVIW